MTNSTTTDSRRVRFEDVTPTNEIVAYFNTELPDLIAGTGLPIFPGYDDLDYIQFSYITLPSGNTVVLGQYENAPEIGVDLYVDLNLQHNSTAIAANIPALVVETLRYLNISKETAIWFHPDYEAEIERLYFDSGEIEPISRESSQADRKYEEPFASAFREEIDCFYYALEIYTRDKLPEYWAMLQHNLGLAYYHRTQGERWINLQKSMECFNNSLEIFEEHKYSRKWQINQEDLQQSQKAWDIEKPNLVRDILDRGGMGRNLIDADLSAVNLSAANLIAADLYGADLRGAFLHETKLIGADLSHTNLTDAELIFADLRNAELIFANLQNANLSLADLSCADLRGAILSSAYLNGAHLSSVNLGDADLNNTDLSHTSLRGANLNNANLRGANLSNANLRGANLNDANLSSVNLSGADLSGANVNSTQFGDNEGISESMQQDLRSRGAIFSK